MPRVCGHEWAFVGGPLAALDMSQRLAGVLGPVGLSVLQQIMAAGAGAALERLVALAREETERAQADALRKAAASGDVTPDVMATVLGTVRATLGSELAGQVLDAVRSPGFREWAEAMLSHMTRDGQPVDPKDPTVTGGEFMAALWEVGKAQAVFR